MKRKHENPFVLSIYFALSCAMTWPLLPGLARDVPGDLGDSLLNMWILGWMAEAIPRVATGQMSVADVWNANIFHPAPLALSFSEHLFGQAIQILPVYHLTKNLILSYNLLFLTSFALSGFTMYLLVRDITGNGHAAFLAGLIYAFVPFRIAQVAHIQSLSSQWMPLALWGFRSYVTTNRLRSLAIGTAALLMQNWSCGYYLIFFTPFVVLFVIHQLFAAGRARQWKPWLSFAVAGVVVAAGTWPFLTLYLEAQRVHGFERAEAEIIGFSADVYSYATAPEALRLLGPILDSWPQPEGELFLGIVGSLLALMAVVTAIRQGRAAAAGGTALFTVAIGKRRFSPRATAVIIVAMIAIALIAVYVGILLTGGFVMTVAGVPVRATNALRVLGQIAIALAALIALSGKFRAIATHVIASPAGIAFVSLVLAIWLSFGPIVHVRGRAIEGIGLYGVLLDFVPGFEGLRVPARYAMIAALYLSVLAGIGAARLRHRTTNGLCVIVLLETAFAPMLVNQTWGSEFADTPPPYVEPADSAPAVYHALAALPAESVVAELPFGDPAWELRYVYYSTVHWKRLINGYSGGFPQSYKVRVARMQHMLEAPDEAWRSLVEAGVTHIVLHEDAMPAQELVITREWLQVHGATELGRFDDDVLFGVRSP
jgi:hypothetical protein